MTATTVISADEIDPPTDLSSLKQKAKESSSIRDGKTASDSAANGEEGSTHKPPPADGAAQSVETRFVFLGDFVDRGYFSLETFTLLMCLKAKFVLHPPLSPYCC